MSSNFNFSYMARSSLTYIPFLAHLAFRPCELLPSLFVRPSTFHILIVSETTGPIATKLWWNGPWVDPSKIVSGDPDFQPRWSTS